MSDIWVRAQKTYGDVKLCEFLGIRRDGSKLLLVCPSTFKEFMEKNPQYKVHTFKANRIIIYDQSQNVGSRRVEYRDVIRKRWVTIDNRGYMWHLDGPSDKFYRGVVIFNENIFPIVAVIGLFLSIIGL